MNEHKNLAAALVAALADLTVIDKGRKANVGTYSYEYADIADVVKLTRPVLAKHGVVALTPVIYHATGLSVTVILLHTSGERMDLGPFPFPHGNTAQATGSMVTYHRRYALVAALGMAAGDDDDGAAAVPRQSPPRGAAAHAKERGPKAEPGVIDTIRSAIEHLTDDERTDLKQWWKAQRIAPLDDLTAVEADRVFDHLESYGGDGRPFEEPAA